MGRRHLSVSVARRSACACEQRRECATVSKASRRIIAPARTRSRHRPGRARRPLSRHPRRSRPSGPRPSSHVIDSTTCSDGGATRANRASRRPQPLGLQRRVGAGRHSLHERQEISFGGYRDQWLRRRDQRDAEEPRQRHYFRGHLLRQFGKSDIRLARSANYGPASADLTQADTGDRSTSRAAAYEAKKDIDRALAEYNEAIKTNPNFDLCLQQPRRSLISARRLAALRRRLRGGDAAAAEQPRPPGVAPAGAGDQPRPDPQALADCNAALKIKADAADVLETPAVSVYLKLGQSDKTRSKTLTRLSGRSQACRLALWARPSPRSARATATAATPTCRGQGDQVRHRRGVFALRPPSVTLCRVVALAWITGFASGLLSSLINSLAACWSADTGGTPAVEHHDRVDRRGQRADKLRARHRHDVGDDDEAELDLALGDQFGTISPSVRRPWPDRIGDAKLNEQLAQMELLAPSLRYVTDLALSSVCFERLGVPMSGSAPSRFTATPMPDDMISARLPANSLPVLIRSVDLEIHQHGEIERLTRLDPPLHHLGDVGEPRQAYNRWPSRNCEPSSPTMTLVTREPKIFSSAEWTGCTSANKPSSAATPCQFLHSVYPALIP